MKPDIRTVAGMDVELVRWPAEQARLDIMRRAGAARLVLVPEGEPPPRTSDILEDWIRLPATEEDIRARVLVLAERAGETNGSELPSLDENGLLRVRDRWVSIPPVEQRLVAVLLDRYGAVVSRDALSRAGWPTGIPDRNVLDVHMVRLRRRLASVGLAIRTVRSRGYLMEQT